MKSVVIVLVCVLSGSKLLAEESTAAQTVAKNKPADGQCKMCRPEPSLLGGITETKWSEPSARKKAFSNSYSITNQDGKRLKFNELCDRPVALTFLYTRCDNPNKCPLAAATFAKLQEEVRKAGIDKKVRLIVMTYDPEYDLPEVLNQYAQEKKIACNDNVMLLQPDPATKKDLFDELNVTVNYNANRVNIHGLQIILLDKQARYVRSYHTLIWDNAKVLGDLKKLADEE